MRARAWISIGVVAVLVAGLAVAARTAWPQAGLRTTTTRSRRLDVPRFSGEVEHVRVRTAAAYVPSASATARSAVHLLRAGERLTVELSVDAVVRGLARRAPRRSGSRSRQPTAQLRGRWLQVEGAPVTVAFDQPSSLVWLGPARDRRLDARRAVVRSARPRRRRARSAPSSWPRRRGRGSTSRRRCASRGSRARLDRAGLDSPRGRSRPSRCRRRSAGAARRAAVDPPDGALLLALREHARPELTPAAGRRATGTRSSAAR